MPRATSRAIFNLCAIVGTSAAPLRAPRRSCSTLPPAQYSWINMSGCVCEPASALHTFKWSNLSPMSSSRAKHSAVSWSSGKFLEILTATGVNPVLPSASLASLAPLASERHSPRKTCPVRPMPISRRVRQMHLPGHTFSNMSVRNCKDGPSRRASTTPRICRPYAQLEARCWRFATRCWRHASRSAPEAPASPSASNSDSDAVDTRDGLDAVDVPSSHREWHASRTRWMSPAS
mmetsp:Transcript_82229/g.251275  ORF Transcript_82229/g.251275 Transcript_82229/m.251275 type:complete len:234 (-) Transcript_82229:343-1044(-)